MSFDVADAGPNRAVGPVASQRAPARVLASFAVAIVVVATGCSRSSSDEEFAERVCSTSIPFAVRMSEAFEDVRLLRAAAGPDARAELVRHVLDGKETAVGYAAEIRAVAVPESDAGSKAQQILEIAAFDSVDVLAREERQIFRLPETMTLAQSGRRLEQLEVTLGGVFQAIVVPPTHIAALVPELTDAFEAADACQELAAVPIE